MAADQVQDLFPETAPGSELMVRLDTRLGSVPVGRGTAVFCSGACFHRREAIAELEILVDGAPQRPAAARMPRLDLFRMLHEEDPEVRCYRSGFWATVPIGARDRPGTVDLDVGVRLASGARSVARLGQLEVTESKGPAGHDGAAKRVGDGLIAVCMATFEPDLTLFSTQIETLRAQTDGNWVCLISDDCSSAERFDEIMRTVGGDERFVVSRSPQNLGYYRNFERALQMVPPEAELVALCDQDDRWHREKLAVLRDALGTAKLVYSDQRLVDAEGRVLRETLWRGRRNNHTNLASLLVANSITGAAMLFRREVAELAVPFPETPGWQFHDHWLGLVALAVGDVEYVDRPLYDYVQHAGAILGQVIEAGDAPAKTGGRRGTAVLERLRRSLRGWRGAYFYGYLSREVQAQALLARCAATLTASKRRVLQRFVAAQRAPLAFAWLAARPLRGLVGANETLGTELELARGILWRHLIEARTGRRQAPGHAALDAACPSLEVDTLGQRRLARWRAQI